MLGPWWWLGLALGSRSLLLGLSQREVCLSFLYKYRFLEREDEEYAILMVCYGTFFVDYLRKIIVQGRSSKSTKVGDIMTEEVVCVCVCVCVYKMWFMAMN